MDLLVRIWLLFDPLDLISTITILERKLLQQLITNWTDKACIHGLFSMSFLALQRCYVLIALFHFSFEGSDCRCLILDLLPLIRADQLRAFAIHGAEKLEQIPGFTFHPKVYTEKLNGLSSRVFETF
jgi:hypothetical protein